MTLTPAEIAAAPPERQYELIEAVWNARNPEPAPVWIPVTDCITDGIKTGDVSYAANVVDREQWSRKRRDFTAKLNCGAFESAVIEMLPKGWAWMTGCAPGEAFFATLAPTDESGIEAEEIVFGERCSAPALALLACIAALPDNEGIDNR